ncbi:MAG: hypothetical protein ACPGXK_06350 [Phycisphaerae bacterium]
MKRIVGSGCMLLAVFGVASTALGGNFFLKPISATGGHTINGNQIVLDGPDQTVRFEIRVDDWGIFADVGICNDGETCSIAAQDCSGGGACSQHNGLLAVYQARIDGSGFQGVLSPVDLGPVDLIDTNNPEYVFAGLGTSIAAADTSSDSFAFGAVLLVTANAPPYGGVDKYGGTLDIIVPPGAVGTFNINFVNNINETFMLDPSSQQVAPLTTEGGIISIACQTNADCDDGNACTNDICNPDDTCSNPINYDDAVFCCDPGNGNLVTIDDGNDCTTDICNPDGTVENPFRAAGQTCGDLSNSECDNPDTCDGAGTCLSNLEPAGTACGDSGDTECDGADTCDGNGMCQSNIAASGTPCGDGSDTECTDPDTCDGIGGCQENNVANGVSCDDGLFCNSGEMCLEGFCAGGIAEDCDDGLTCTDDMCDEDSDSCMNDLIAGNCLIEGACFADGELNPDNDCEACDVATSTSDWTQLAAGTECDDGNACTGTGNPGIGVDTCDEAGVCMGMLDPNCNDSCEDSLEVFPGINMSNNGSAAPIDDDEASCQPNSNNDIWFVYNATCDGELLLSTTGSDLQPSNDTVITVYEECGGDEIACDDEGGVGLQAAVTITTTGGTAYFIRVAGFEDNVGDVVLQVVPVDDCVIDGVCYEAGAVNPNNECEFCSPAVSNSSWTPRIRGTACGDQADTECDSPDACDGAGICEQNFKPDGTACEDDLNECSFDVCQSGVCSHPPRPAGTVCGDPSDTECDNPDSCDGLGACLDNFELQGVACGDQSMDQCDQPDICNGNGGCDDNFQPVGTPCDDGDVCTGMDVCDTGSCAGTAIAEAPFVEAIGSKILAVTPLPAGSPGPVALLVTADEYPCLSQYVTADGLLQDDPVFQLIDDWGTILVKGDDIVPESIYNVQAECGAFTSAAGQAETGRYADIDGNGDVNIADIQLIVLGFQFNFDINSPEELDIWPCTPNGSINFEDIQLAVLMFQGFTYADFCPIPCE